MRVDRFIKITKGLDIRLKGSPQLIRMAYTSPKFAITPPDFKWITPQLIIEEGATVRVGDPLFIAKENPNITFVAPVSGTVTEIVRGEKRRIMAVIIEKDNKNSTSIIPEMIKEGSPEEIIDTMLGIGVWPMVRQRPFGTIANPDQQPKAIYISCFDTAPLAPDLHYVLQDKGAQFAQGVKILSQLTKGNLYLSIPADHRLLEKWLEKEVLNKIDTTNIKVISLKGKHPAGNVGTQIHFVTPIQKGEVVWYVDPQHTANIGILFLHKQLDFSRTVALTGSEVKNPQYYDTIIGAALSDLLEEQVDIEYSRVVSGNLLTGRNVGKDGFIGFYDHQISVISDDVQREFLGWMTPGLNKFSLSRTFLSFLMPRKEYVMDTRLHGGQRALMFSDVYSRVFPFRLLPDQLLKACITKDLDLMEALGIYEVVEEDFALCEFVCPSKTNCQQIVHDALWELVK